MDPYAFKKIFKSSGLSLPEFLDFIGKTRGEFENHMKTIANNKAKTTIEYHKRYYKEQLIEFRNFKIKQLKMLPLENLL